MTHGGLRDAQPTRGAGHAAFFEQHIQRDERSRVDLHIAVLSSMQTM